MYSVIECLFFKEQLQIQGLQYSAWWERPQQQLCPVSQRVAGTQEVISGIYIQPCSMDALAGNRSWPFWARVLILERIKEQKWPWWLVANKSYV